MLFPHQNLRDVARQGIVVKAQFDEPAPVWDKIAPIGKASAMKVGNTAQVAHGIAKLTLTLPMSIF
jgi:hypothetical protein